MSTNSATTSRDSPRSVTPLGDGLAGDGGPDVLAEQVLDALALAQSGGHLVDAALQHADLADVVHLDGRVELAAADQAHDA